MALEGYETTTDCKKIAAAVDKTVTRRQFKLSKGLKKCHACNITCALCLFFKNNLFYEKTKKNTTKNPQNYKKPIHCMSLCKTKIINSRTSSKF